MRVRILARLVVASIMMTTKTCRVISDYEPRMTRVQISLD